MAIDISGYNDTFKAFADFARIHDDLGEKNSIARLSQGVNITEGALAGRTITASKTDSLRGFFKWFRGSDEQRANNAVRDLFKNAVYDMFGGESKVPQSVKNAMKMADYNKGKPLTARRILIVKTAIDNYRNTLESDTLTTIKQMYANDDAERLDSVSPSIDKLVERAKGDPDMLRLLTGGNCAVADGIICDSNNNVRSEEEQVTRFNAVKQNLDELRELTKGNAGAFNAVFSQLDLLEGKALPNGVLTKVFESAGKIDISPLANISPQSSPKEIANAFCHIDKAIATVCRDSKIMQSFTGEVGSNQRTAVSSIVMGILLSRCDKKTMQNLNATLFSKNCANFMTICSDFNQDLTSKKVDNELAKTHDKEIIHATRKFASTFDVSASFRQALVDVLRNALGTKVPSDPDAGKLTKDDYINVYDILERHTIEEHQEIVESAKKELKNMQFVELG